MVRGRTGSALCSPNRRYRWSPVGVVVVPCGDRIAHQHVRKSVNTAIVQSPRPLSRLPLCIVPRDTPRAHGYRARRRRRMPCAGRASHDRRQSQRDAGVPVRRSSPVDHRRRHYPRRRAIPVALHCVRRRLRSSGLPSAGRDVRRRGSPRALPTLWFPALVPRSPTAPAPRFRPTEVG